MDYKPNYRIVPTQPTDRWINRLVSEYDYSSFIAELLISRVLSAAPSAGELEKNAKKKAWLNAMPAPEYTYDLDSHPEGYDGPCCCADCRSYASG